MSAGPYILSLVCNLCSTNFNTEDHRPGRLKGKECKDVICQRAFERALDSDGIFQCGFCKQPCYSADEFESNEELLREWILVPLYCEIHPDSPVDYFCKFHKSLHCIDCERLERRLCTEVDLTEADLNREVSIAIQTMENEFNWSPAIKQRCIASRRTASILQKLQLIKDMKKVGPKHLHRNDYGPQFYDNKDLVGVEGTLIPPSTLQEPLRRLNRFFAIHPIEDCPYNTLDRHMRPWPVDSSVDQIEAFSFSALEPMFLAGLTLACPIDKSEFKIKYAKLVEGSSTSGPLYSDLIPPNTVISPQNRPICEYLFPTIVRVEPCTPYTLTLQLKAMDEESTVLFFKGNILTKWSDEEAHELLYDDGRLKMEITPAEKTPKETMGQIEAGGPILGFFYQATN